MSEERLLNTQEVLKRLNISRTTLYALMERGTLKPIENKPTYLTRHPRLWFRESDIEKLLHEKPSDREASHAA